MSRELRVIRHRIKDREGRLDDLLRSADSAGPARKVLIIKEAEALSAELEGLRRDEQKLLDDADAEARGHELQQRAFWFQRLNTSLAIAHGAGFAAVSSHLFDATTTQEAVGLSLPAMATFGLGALVAGAIPLPLAFERRRIANWLLGFAALLFGLAVFLAIKGAWLKSVARVWIWQP